MGKKEWEKDVVLKKLDERSYEIETPSGTSEEIVLTSGKPQRYHLSHCKHPMRLRRMRTHHPQHPHQSSDAVPETQPGWQGPGQQSGNLVPRVFRSPRANTLGTRLLRRSARTTVRPSYLEDYIT